MNQHKNDSNNIFKLIFQELKATGFACASVAEVAEIPENYKKIYENWLETGKAGTMSFLSREDYKNAYFDPKTKFPWAKSIITAGFPYNTLKKNSDTVKIHDSYKISRYAHNRDYHNVLTEKLEKLTGELKAKYPNNNFAFQVDAGALPEIYWAEQAGIGKRAKNGLLYIPEFGSWFFIALIITDFKCTSEITEKFSALAEIHLECSNCDKCLKACPTGAIYEPYKIDASKCVSYLTIEHKGDFPPGTKLHNWFFGCDVCQQVCPMNQKVKLADSSDFKPWDCWADFDIKQLEKMSKKQFKEKFSGTPMIRTGLSRLLRNFNQLTNK